MKQLKQSSGWAYQEIAPTRLFDLAKYQAALQWATDPIEGPGPPHAILIISPDRNGYQLLDALTGPLTPPGHIRIRLLAHRNHLDTSAAHPRLRAGRFRWCPRLVRESHSGR